MRGKALNLCEYDVTAVYRGESSSSMTHLMDCHVVSVGIHPSTYMIQTLALKKPPLQPSHVKRGINKTRYCGGPFSC